MSAPVFCENCGHSKAMHYAHGNHPCVICPNECLGFVSPVDARWEQAKKLAESALRTAYAMEEQS